MKQHHSLFSCLLCLLVSLMLSSTSQAKINKLTNTAQWEVRNDSLFISGTGAIPDMERPASKYWHNKKIKPQINHVIIGNGISHVGKAAFSDMPIRSVLISKSVTLLGADSFCGCENLTQLTIPNNITQIGLGAFSACNSLQNIHLPDNLSKIPDYAFSGCKSLTTITLPNSIRHIGTYAFKGCTSLTNITLPNSIETIESYAFDGCSTLTSVDFSNSRANLQSRAFVNCNSLQNISRFKNLRLSTKTETHDYYSWSGKIKYKSGSSTYTIGPFSATPLSDITNIRDLTDYFSQPSRYNTLQEYIDCVMMPLDEYIASQQIKAYTAPSQQEIELMVKAEVEKWQQKGEFETTSDWQRRVTETSRRNYIQAATDNVVKTVRANAKQYTTNYNNALKQYKKIQQSHIDKYFDYKKEEAKKEFANNNTQLTLAPYDADNQTFLIRTKANGDILLPVPNTKAQDFKKNWSSISKNIEPEFVPDGNDVILTKITFRDGKNAYVYDSHTNARYAIANIDYNFSPIEVADINVDDIALNLTPIDGQKAATSSISVAGNNNKGIVPKQAEIEQHNMTAGSLPEIDARIPHNNTIKTNTFAVVIANENYKRAESVPFAANDGKIVSQYLIQTLGVPEKNVQLLTDASLNDMRYALNHIKDVCNAYKGDASVIVYYSGHGIPDERTANGYLLPVDAYTSDLSTALSLNELYATLSGLPAKFVALFTDACFSGAKRDGGMLVSARGVTRKPKEETPEGNLVALTATQGDETAYPYKEKRHGLMTYFLLKKLQDTNGNVTFGELADYVIDNVGRISIIENQKKQTPSVLVSPAVTSTWRQIKL